MSYDPEWEKAKEDWKRSNPPDHAGYYYCVIGGGALTDGSGDSIGGLPFNLGHNRSRARNPAEKYDTSDHSPICPYHNRGQGSMTFAEYRAKNPSKRCRI